MATTKKADVTVKRAAPGPRPGYLVYTIEEDEIVKHLITRKAEEALAKIDEMGGIGRYMRFEIK